MTGLLRTQFIGNLGADPELKYTQSGTPVCNFSVAVNQRWTDRTTQEKREKTTWIRCAAWGSLAEVCNQWISKGSQVYIEGEPKVSAYINKAGEAAASLEVTVQTIQFLNSSSAGNSNNFEAPAADTDVPEWMGSNGQPDPADIGF